MSNNKPNMSLYLELSTDPVASKKTGQRGTKKRLSFSPQEDSDEEESDQVKNKRKRQEKQGKSSKSAASKKDERIDELIDKIRGSLSSENLFIAPQIRIWADMVDVGTHSSLSTPPKIPALGFKNTKKPTVTEKLTESVSAMASSFGSLSSVMSPQAAGSFISVTSASVPQPINAGRSCLDTTPGRKSKLRGECIEQIKQLKELFDLGAISEEEYNEKKNVILSQIHRSYFKTTRNLKYCCILIATTTVVLFQIVLFR